MPGVTVRSAVQSAPRRQTSVRTDVAGFLGFAERGPTQKAIRIHSWAEYRTFFGGHVRGAYLSHAVQGFFANGGRACWIVRIANQSSWGTSAGRAEHEVELPTELARWDLDLEDVATLSDARRRALLTAVSPGPWGRFIEFRPNRLDVDRFSVELRCPGSETEVREGLTFPRLIDSINTEYLPGQRRQSGRGSDDGEDLARGSGASNIARVRLQLLLRLPALDDEGSVLPDEESDVDLVLTLDDYRAWHADVRIGWTAREGNRLSLLARYKSTVDGGTHDLHIDATDPIDLVARINELGTQLGDAVETERRIAAGVQTGRSMMGPAPERGHRRVWTDRPAGVRVEAPEGAAARPGLRGRLTAHLAPRPADGGPSRARAEGPADAPKRRRTIDAFVESWTKRRAPTPLLFGRAPVGDLSVLSDLIWAPSPGQSLLEGLGPRHFGASEPGDGGAMRAVTPMGLRLFDEIEEIGIVAAPDMVLAYGLDHDLAKLHDIDRPLAEPATDLGALAGLPESSDPAALMRALQRALVEHCAHKRNRVAILDVPPDVQNGRGRPHGWRRGLENDARSRAFGALYYPWILVKDPRGGDALTVPPSGHIAGVYSQVEQSWGVHEAPANIALIGSLDTSVPTTDRNHAELNDLHVNVLRSLPGRGVRPLGARTLAPPDDPARFVNVRRLLNWLIASLEQALAWTTFEPNGPRLREEVERVVRAFLSDMWKRGMLSGRDESQAYHVTCDGGLNPGDALHENRLVCEIGILPAQPAEYVIVHLVREDDRSSVFETRRTRSG